MDELQAVGRPERDGSLPRPVDSGQQLGLIGAGLVVELQLDGDPGRQAIGCGVRNLRHGPLGGLPDQVPGFFRMQVQRRRRRESLLDDRAFDLIAEERAGLLHRLVVARNKDDRNAEMTGDSGVDTELARGDAVEPNILQPRGPRMGQRSLRGPCLGVVTRIEDGSDAFEIDALHHAKRLVGA